MALSTVLIAPERTHRHEHVIGRVREAGCRASRAAIVAARPEAGVVHVAVTPRPVSFAPPRSASSTLRRRIQIRIAQREIEDVLRAALRLQARAFLEHAADPGGPLQLL